MLNINSIQKINTKFYQSFSGIGKSGLVFLSTLTLGHLVVHWYMNLLSLSLPFIHEDLNLSEFQLSLLTTVQIGAASCLFIVSGFLADSFRQRGAMIVASAIISFGIAFFLIGVSSSYLLTLFAVGMVGLGTGLWHPAAMGALSLQFPDRRGMALAVHGVGASVGDVIGPIIVGAIILVVDWKLTLQIHILPALLISFFLWRSLGLMRESIATKITFSEYLEGIRVMVTNSQGLAVMLSYSLIHMSRLSILTFLPIYISETLNYDSLILGVYLALLYVMGILSQPVMGVLSDMYGRKVILLPSFACMGILYFGLMSSGIILALVVTLLGIFFYAILNMSQTAIMDVAPTRVQSSSMGVMGLCTVPFTIVHAWLASSIVTTYGIENIFVFAGVTGLIAAAILIPVKFHKTF